MTTESYTAVAFYALAFLIILGALGVVILPRIVHSALSLVFFFAIIAGVYVLLQAEFIAATQIIIYVGAITVLFLFAIMLTHNSYGPDSNPKNNQAAAAGLVALITFVTLCAVLVQMPLPVGSPATPGGVLDVTRALGQLLMGTFFLPFEIAGVLLLAAMIGAIVIAKES